MKVELTALIASQARTFLVMMAAGILTETLWQVKEWVQGRTGRPGAGSQVSGSQGAGFGVSRGRGFKGRESKGQGSKGRISRSRGFGSARRGTDAIPADGGRNRQAFAGRILMEAVFWIAAAGILSGFLYYCAYGKLSIHAAAGYFIGLLLWKKILQCVILSP